MTEKGQKWNTRKNKLGVIYYMIMLIFAFTMLLIIWGFITTQDIQDWWYENITLPLP